MVFALSPVAAASRTLRIEVFTEDLIDWLRKRAFSLVVMRLIWDLILATSVLLIVFGGFRVAFFLGTDPSCEFSGFLLGGMPHGNERQL
jgi:hypothetical protein